MNIDELADADREEKIRARAHEIWEREGRPAGRAELHWEQASREIEGEAARSQSSKRRVGLRIVSSPAKIESAQAQVSLGLAGKTPPLRTGAPVSTPS